MKKLLSLILAITLTLTLFASCGETEKALTSTELLDLGEKYLLDLNYEEAIVYFNKVIEVEPRNSRAYMGAAEAYVGLGDTESAIAILQKGIELVDDPTELEAMLSELLGESETETENEVPEDEAVQEEIIEDEPFFETTAVYYCNANESVGCGYSLDSNGAFGLTQIYLSWSSFSLAGTDAGGYYITYTSSSEESGYNYATETSFSAYLQRGYTYEIVVYACTGSSYESMGTRMGVVGNATIEADGTVSYTDGLTVACESGYYCTLSCNQSSLSSDSIYLVYVDGAFLTAAEDTTQSFVLPSGSYEITVIASNTNETIGSLTLTVGDTSFATHDDGDYEYEYDSNGKAISRSITTYAEDGSYSVEYQTRVN